LTTQDQDNETKFKKRQIRPKVFCTIFNDPNSNIVSPCDKMCVPDLVMMCQQRLWGASISECFA